MPTTNTNTTTNTTATNTTVSDVVRSIQVLHPSRYYTNYSTNQTTTTKQRFSSLLLEYGEQELHDWAVVASSSSSSSSYSSSDSNNNSMLMSADAKSVMSSSSSFNHTANFKQGSNNSSNSTGRSSNNYISTITSTSSNSFTNGGTTNRSNTISYHNNSNGSNGTMKSIFRAHKHLSHMNKSYSSSSLSLSSQQTSSTNTNATHKTSSNNDGDDNSNNNNNKTSTLPKKTFRKKKRSKSKYGKNSSSSSATAEGTNSMKRVQGRLYLCTKSIVFEPSEISRGVIRCPFDKMTIKPVLNQNNSNNTNNSNQQQQHHQQQHQQQQQQQTISFTTTKYIIMKKNNIIKPYTIIDEFNENAKKQSSTSTSTPTPTTTFSFTFLFSKPTQFLNICNTIYANPQSHLNSRLSFSKSGSTSTSQSHHQPKFNIHNLNHLTETPQITSLQSYILSPLMSKAGCTMITEQYLYFQPVHGVIGISNNSNSIHGNTPASTTFTSNDNDRNNSVVKVSSWKLSSIIATARRYHGLKDSALELFFHEYDDSTTTTSSSSLSDDIENIHYGNGSNKNNQLQNLKQTHNDTQKYSKSNDHKQDNDHSLHSSSLLIAFQSRKDREKVMSLLPKIRYVTDGRVGGDDVDDNDDNGDSNAHQYPQSYESNGNGNDNDETIMRKKIATKVFCHTDSSFVKQVMKLWMKGILSNFDYLLALNSAAGRSFHDLSRYPVFPWVVKDYECEKLDCTGSDHHGCQQIFRDLSKPIGALNEERLAQFKERWSSMQDMDVASFLYGTHYSAPGYCLYYLVRLMPEHMLCLQNGKYDTPDRLFHSIRHCYASLLTNPADLKESIPQFYDPRTGVDLLLNLNCLQLGVTQNGTIINDVELPAWATSPKDFLKKNRMALESNYCTQHLPSWIDLIFGEKSRGSKAEEALNVFHPTSYLSPEEVDQMDTEEMKIQAELQATEFGVCPDMLFNVPHPQRSGNVDVVDDLSTLAKNRPLDSGFQDAYNSDSNIIESKEWELLSREDGMESINQSNEDKPTTQLTKKDIEPSLSASTEYVSNLEKHGNSNHEDFQFIDPSANEYESAEQDNKVRIPLSGSGDSNRNSDDGLGLHEGTFGARSNNSDPSLKKSNPISTTKSQSQHRFSDKQGPTQVNNNSNWELQMITSKQIHSDAISGCHISFGKKKSNITTTSLDGSLMVHILPNYSMNVGRRGYSSKNENNNEFQSTKHLHSFRSHTSSDPLACLSVIVEEGSDGNGQIAFAGGHDDVIFAYGVNSACGLASVYSHRDAITGIDLLPIQPTGDNGTYLDGTHVMISGSWDATVKLWNVSIKKGEVVSMDKDPIVELFDTESSISNVAGVHGMDGRLYVAAGCTDGGLTIWCWDGREKSVKYQEMSRKGFGSCSSVHWAKNEKTFLYAGFGNGKMASYLLKDGEIYPVGVLDIGSSVNCLHAINHIVLLGCEDGGVRLVKVEKDGHLDYQPILFPGVDGRHSCPISTISAMKAFEGNLSTQNEILCVIGGQDGYVTAFNIYES